MKDFLDNIRRPDIPGKLSKEIRNTVLILLLGILLGAFSKYLDCTPGNEQLYLLELLDVGNFLGRMSVWILLAAAVAVYSCSPIRAGINVFCFFTGMLVSYYAYTYFIAGFFPRSYVMIWAVLTLISPFLAFVCWYARGRGPVACLISAAIVGVLFMQAFYFGMFYFDPGNPLEILVWLIGIAMLYRSPGQLAAMLGMSVAFAVILNGALPFRF